MQHDNVDMTKVVGGKDTSGSAIKNIVVRRHGGNAYAYARNPSVMAVSRISLDNDSVVRSTFVLPREVWNRPGERVVCRDEDVNASGVKYPYVPTDTEIRNWEEEYYVSHTQLSESSTLNRLSINRKDLLAILNSNSEPLVNIYYEPGLDFCMIDFSVRPVPEKKLYETSYLINSIDHSSGAQVNADFETAFLPPMMLPKVFPDKEDDVEYIGPAVTNAQIETAKRLHVPARALTCFGEDLLPYLVVNFTEIDGEKVTQYTDARTGHVYMVQNNYIETATGLIRYGYSYPMFPDVMPISHDDCFPEKPKDDVTDFIKNHITICSPVAATEEEAAERVRTFCSQNEEDSEYDDEDFEDSYDHDDEEEDDEDLFDHEDDN